ncbi:hypothetical protein Tco_0950252, partial [Tanacetum coccineum]
ASDTLPNDGIFNGAYNDDEDVGAVADFNMDNTIAVSLIPTLRIHKDHPKGQFLGDLTSAVQIRGKIQKASLAQQALEEGIDYDEVFAPVAWIEEIRGGVCPSTSRLGMRHFLLFWWKMPLGKDEDSKDVDAHVYRSMIGSLMYLTTSRPDI